MRTVTSGAELRIDGVNLKTTGAERASAPVLIRRNNHFNNYKTQLSEVIDEFHTGDENTDYQEISDRYVSLYNEVEEYLIENEQIALLDNIYLKEIEQRYVDFKVNYLSVSSEIDFDYNYINYVQDEYYATGEHPSRHKLSRHHAGN